MDYKKLTENDLDIILPFMNRTYGRLCDYSPSATLMWGRFYETEYYADDSVFLQRAVSPYSNEHFYCLPLGDTERGIKMVLEDCSAPVLFGIIPKEYSGFFDIDGYEAEITADRDHFDYLYNASDLIGLKGKKYAGQRNHIHKFDNIVSTWQLRDITDENLSAVIDFYNQDFRLNRAYDFSSEAESRITMNALCDTAKYGLSGSALYADGRIVGFALGEVIGDTLFVHSEKADRSFPGAYQKLVNTFTARYAAEGVEYVNREDDLGSEGLRTAKLAYHPCQLLEKLDIKMKKKP